MSLPSRATAASPKRAPGGSKTSITLSSLTSTGRKDSDAGAIGVKRVHGPLGDTIGPPQLKLYPVDPVGDDIMIPSPSTRVTNVPSTKIFNLPIALPRLSTAHSFSAYQVARDR